jgi:hypothetical protein
VIDPTVGGIPPDQSPVTLASWFEQRYVMNTTSPKHPNGKPLFTDDPGGSGNKVMVCHLQNSDPPYTPGFKDQRTEIVVQREYTPPGEERWYAMSFNLDQNWPTYDKDTQFVLMQLHTSQKTWIATPPLHVMVRGDRLTLTCRHNTRPVPPQPGWQAYEPYEDYYASKENTSEIHVELGKVVKQKWYCFVINAGWSCGDGHLKIWMNGSLVYQQSRMPNCYLNLEPGLGNWPKIGIYAPGGFGPMWDARPAWVKSYVHWVTVAAPGGVGPSLMYDQTPCKGIAVVP